MIDDSLSDTQQWNRTFDMLVKDATEIEQQEKKMSAEQIVIKDEVGNSIKIRRGDVGFVLNIKDMNGPKNAFLTKEQAHLLMLYLQEHLNAK